MGKVGEAELLWEVWCKTSDCLNVFSVVICVCLTAVGKQVELTLPLVSADISNWTNVQHRLWHTYQTEQMSNTGFGRRIKLNKCPTQALADVSNWTNVQHRLWQMYQTEQMSNTGFGRHIKLNKCPTQALVDISNLQMSNTGFGRHIKPTNVQHRLWQTYQTEQMSNTGFGRPSKLNKCPTQALADLANWTNVQHRLWQT